MHANVRPLFALAAILALASCTKDRPTAGPGPNYQAPVASVAPPANLQAICFDSTQVSAYRARLTQQELAVGTLACKGPDGNRRFDTQYGQFLEKFKPDLQSNAGDLKDVVTRKGRNFDVVVTEMANRTAQQPNTDGAFCSRIERALQWSLSPTVTSLSQVPPPYDFGPNMSVFACIR